MFLKWDFDCFTTGVNGKLCNFIAIYCKVVISDLQIKNDNMYNIKKDADIYNRQKAA